MQNSAAPGAQADLCHSERSEKSATADPSLLRGMTGTDRRTLLGRCLALLALPPEKTSYRRLVTPVVVPLSEVAKPWRPVAFTAVAPQRRLQGILLRMPKVLKAFCLMCPHEICQVSFTEDTQSVRVEDGPRPDHPLLVCPCHFSVFDPLAEGARIAGPAHRGLYRFGLRIRRQTVEIREVEEGALR